MRFLESVTASLNSIRFALYKYNTDDLETTILHLYSKGITTFEIADLIEKIYGYVYSKQIISNITKTIKNMLKNSMKDN